MRNRQQSHSHGMTLVELLVVVAIMVLLLAVSVPMLRPMLDSQRSSEAAKVLASTFQQARMKAIQERVYYEVHLIPFQNATTTAIELRLQRGGTRSYVNPDRVRVRVENGAIIPYLFDGITWQRTDWNSPVESPDLMAARRHFEENGEIQFNYIGRQFRFFGIADGNPNPRNPRLDSPYDGLNLPEFPQEAMEYRVTQRDVAMSWLPPVVMPHGTIVDLVFSGGETVDFDGNPKTPANLRPIDIPPSFSSGDSVVVVFSPAGHVDSLRINGVPRRVNEMLYFCVGEWARQVGLDSAGNFRSLADDGRTNRDVPSTYWVTLHPKTGGVRIAENNVAVHSETELGKLDDARRFAREHFFDVGER